MSAPSVTTLTLPDGSVIRSWKIGNVGHGVLTSYDADDEAQSVYLTSSSDVVARPCTYDAEHGEAVIHMGETALVITLGGGFELMSLEEYHARVEWRLEEEVEAEDTDEEEDDHDDASAE